MKTILVPTDFSETAYNATMYAIALAKSLSVTRIVLYNAYQIPFSGDPTMPVMQLFNLDDIKKTSGIGLDQFKGRVSPFVDSKIALETLSEFAILSDNIEDICERTQADLVVMGITGGSGLDVLIGSNTVSVADHSKIPVLIIPTTTTFKPIQNVVLVCDFKNIAETMPVAAIKNLLDETMAKLHVLNIDHHNKNYTVNTPHESFVLDELLKGYNPQYHYVDSKSFADATNDFVDVNHVDMIITIPKKHGFFENIFRTSHTKQLAFHTHVPLLCIHEEH